MTICRGKWSLILINEKLSNIKILPINVGREGKEKPKYAGLRKGQTIESIDLESALELFSFPKNDKGLFGH